MISRILGDFQFFCFSREIKVVSSQKVQIRDVFENFQFFRELKLLKYFFKDLTFIVESVYSVDTGALMVASE